MYARVQIARIPKQKMGLRSMLIPATGRYACEVPQVNFTGTPEESGNLFAEKRIPRGSLAIRRRLVPELAAARVLCHQLRNKRARPDKERIVHLICLNLQAMLKHRPLPASRS